MTDRDPFADQRGQLIRDMDDGAILEIAPRTDLDPVNVAAQNRALPDTGFFA
ncbi:MAG: hypothetical protein ABIR29_08845 [Chthoniobacterales bacterium]